MNSVPLFPTPWLPRLALGTLAITLLVLLLGEFIGGPRLSISGSFISEFAARETPSGTLVRASMWGFGLTYLLSAATLIRWQRESTGVLFGALCLAAAASLLPFVAEFRMWDGEPLRTPGLWEKLKNVFADESQPKMSSGSTVVAVRAQAHGFTIIASMYWVVAAMVLTTFGVWRASGGKTLARWSLPLALGSFALFRFGQAPVVAPWRGLLELLAFSCVAAWLILISRGAMQARMPGK